MFKKNLAGILALGSLTGAVWGGQVGLKDSQLLVLGTAAGEGIPAIYCNCDFCQKVRKAGGKNLRFRSAYQLGNTIRIDWGADGAAQTRFFKLPAWKLRHLFFTHSHEDHCWAGDFWVRKASQIPGQTMLKVYGNPHVLKLIDTAIGGDWKGNLMEPVEMLPGKQVKLPELNITVTALHANHTAPERSLMYHFKTPDAEILFTGDTGEFMPSAWETMAKIGAKIDYVLIDTTWGMKEPGGGHFGFKGAAKTLKELKERHLAAPGIRMITTHMAHVGGMYLHPELEKLLPPLGLEPGYDGMLLELKK